MLITPDIIATIRNNSVNVIEVKIEGSSSGEEIVAGIKSIVPVIKIELMNSIAPPIRNNTMKYNAFLNIELSP